MRTYRRVIGALAVLAVMQGVAGAGDTPGLDARVSPVTHSKSNKTWNVVDESGQKIGSTTWRVVKGTGNCCENHLGSTADGRLLDFGGNYLRFSADKGQTWSVVQPLEPLLGAEGTVAVAPNGDIVGITWDPYTGDRVLSFKHDAATKQWQYMYSPLHTPFYDREWISVVEGPFTVGAVTVPYITVIRGGWPSKALWYYSLDGLHYTMAANKVVDQQVEAATTAWLPTKAAASADWTQPIVESGVAPLTGGGALAPRIDTLDNSGGVWAILKPGALRWSRFKLGDGTDLPNGRIAQDSRGWLHLVSVSGGAIAYRVSTDGGRTWSATTAALPPNLRAENWDFRANGALGLTAIAIHANAGGPDQDVVVKFSTACPTPALRGISLVGAGDLVAGGSFGVNSAPRFDFATMAILADGSVATSFIDASNNPPAVAVELSTNVPVHPEGETCDAPVAD